MCIRDRQVSGQTMYSAEDRDIRGAEQDYKKLEKELDNKIKRTPTDHPGYNEYQYHLDPIEHDPWQLTSFLTTLYDDYTRSKVQGKLKETFKKQYKLTTWVEVQTRYMTVWVMTPAGIPVPTPVSYTHLQTSVICWKNTAKSRDGRLWQSIRTMASQVLTWSVLIYREC